MVVTVEKEVEKYACLDGCAQARRGRKKVAAVLYCS